MHCYFLKIDACDASKIYIKKTLFSRFKKFVGIFLRLITLWNISLRDIFIVHGGNLVFVLRYDEDNFCLRVLSLKLTN